MIQSKRFQPEKDTGIAGRGANDAAGADEALRRIQNESGGR
jgi:hypothetical protein